MLGLTPEQKKEIEAFQKEVDATLEKTLTDEQKKKLPSGAPPAPADSRDAGARPDHVDLDPGGPEADARAEDAAGRPPEGGRRQARQGPDRRPEEAAQADEGRLRPRRTARRPGPGGPPGGPGGPGGGPPAVCSPARREAARSSGPTSTARTIPAWPARTSSRGRPSRSCNPRSRRRPRIPQEPGNPSRNEVSAAILSDDSQSS